MSFGERLKKAREKNGLSQQALASALNITDGTIHTYEKGIAFPRWDKIKQLCEILSVEPNYLFWDDLSTQLKEKILTTSMRDSNDITISLYERLDVEDKAEIRGTVKQMLKSEKYKNGHNQNNFTIDDIATEIEEAMTKSKVQS